MVEFLSIDYVMQTKERITGDNKKATETFYNHTCFPIFNISGF